MSILRIVLVLINEKRHEDSPQRDRRIEEACALVRPPRGVRWPARPKSSNEFAGLHRSGQSSVDVSCVVSGLEPCATRDVSFCGCSQQARAVVVARFVGGGKSARPSYVQAQLEAVQTVVFG